MRGHHDPCAGLDERARVKSGPSYTARNKVRRYKVAMQANTTTPAPVAPPCHTDRHANMASRACPGDRRLNASASLLLAGHDVEMRGVQRLLRPGAIGVVRRWRLIAGRR